MYSTRKSIPTLPTIPASPLNYEDDEFEDAISDASTCNSWRSAKNQKSEKSVVSSLNNNAPRTRATTSCSHHHSTCHRHKSGHDTCTCIRVFYEDDEVCRKNGDGRLEFGIVVRQQDKLKILWTIGNNVKEQEIDEDAEPPECIRLIDRKASPGDSIHVNKKKGEVVGVSWNCHVLVLENNMSVLNVPCAGLEPLLPHYQGQKLEYLGWVGTIVNVATEATLLFLTSGRTGVVDCSSLPLRHQPYPGRKVKYTINQLVEAKLRFLDDKRAVPQVFKGQGVIIEAFVLFLNVTDVSVKWNGRIRNTNSKSRCKNPDSSSTQPPTNLSKTNLKKHGRVLGAMRDVDWESCHDVVDKYFQYTIKDQDTLVSEGGIEEYMKARYFDEEPDKRTASVKDLREKGTKICTNVAYNVRVCRFNRIVKVKWCSSGKLEKIASSQITEKRTFNYPFHQIVQRSLLLSPYTYDLYGITLSRDSNDMVQVQWVAKARDPNGNTNKFTFDPKYINQEPVYNLEPHFAFGSIRPREIVFRSCYCRIPEAYFSIGWVRSVNQLGVVIVVSAHTKQEHMLYPLELESTGMKIDDVSSENDTFRLSRYTDLVKQHGINVLRNADAIFIQTLSIQETSYFPDHFILLPKCPTTHTFYKNMFSVRSDGAWMKAVKKDQTFLTTRMNDEIGSIWIKGFRDRLDLFSVLLTAPPGTPYEGGLFALDLQLIPEYPKSPPAIYLHTSVGNLQSGTKQVELQDLRSHSLVESILELQLKLFQGSEDPFSIPSSAASLARRVSHVRECEEAQVNAHVIIDVMELMFRSVMDPLPLWSTEIVQYFNMTFERTKERLLNLVDVSNPYSQNAQEWILPTFPLFPVSQGFVEAVLARVKRLEQLVEKSEVL